MDKPTHCKNEVNSTIDCSAHKEYNLKSNLDGQENDLVHDIVISQCDSSFEECKPVKNTTCESKSPKNFEHAMPVCVSASDNESGKSCISSHNMDSDKPEVLNINSSSVSSLSSPNLVPVAGVELKDLSTTTVCNVSNMTQDNQHLSLPVSKPTGICNTDKTHTTEMEHLQTVFDNKSQDQITTMEENLSNPHQESEKYSKYDNCKSLVASAGICDSANYINVETESESMLYKNRSLKNALEDKISSIEASDRAVELEKNLNIYCSTPVVSQKKSVVESQSSVSSNSNEFGQVSPLTCYVKNKMNLKRKNLDLECIEEVDENAPDICPGKKGKYVKENLDELTNDQDISSSIPCFEPPAKSILKKWQPSCLSRNSASSSFFVLDECGESEEEDNSKPNEDVEPGLSDDFEVAYKSLTEELMKSSSNIGTLEKYHSQVQLESQMDDEKFDEVLQELILNYECDDKTSLSFNIKEECIVSNSKNLEVLVQDNAVNDTNMTAESEVKCLTSTDSSSGENKCNNKTILQKLDNPVNKIKDENNITLSVKVKEEAQPQTSSSDKIPNSKLSDQNSKNEQLSILYADGKDMTMDEEDVLLEEDISAKKKPYVFFEFVSSDPKENEDNYNPEWQKLGRLTSDEERYKAVRDRWRSLVPPDPNRDLTCRQWREKNNKPPLNLPTLNNNHQMHQDSKRNQLCTAVFDIKIKKMVQELEDGRLNIMRNRNRDFEELGQAQDEEQRVLTLRRGNSLDLNLLHKHHIEGPIRPYTLPLLPLTRYRNCHWTSAGVRDTECRKLKNRHDEELKRITSIIEEKIRILKNASDEVLLFQKFYKGVGDDEICLYMTGIQVQEVMETEEMLDQYATFYKK